MCVWDSHFLDLAHTILERVLIQWSQVAFILLIYQWNTLNTIWKTFNIFLALNEWVAAKVATLLLEIWMEGKGSASSVISGL